MTKALLVTSSFLPGHGGIETYLAELCDELAPQLAVIAPPERGDIPLPGDLSYPTVPGPNSMLVPEPRVRSAIERAAHRLGTDKLLFGTPWPLILLAPALARRGFTYASIVHGSELLVPGALPVVRKRFLRALAGADLLLQVSAFTRGKLDALFEDAQLAAPPMELLRARVDTNRFRPERALEDIRTRYGVPYRAPLLLHMGRLVKRKGVDRLLDVVPELVEKHPGLRVLIGGTGPELPDIQRRAKSEKAVTVLGRVPEEDAPGLYACADVFVLPVADRWFGLDTEGLGVVLLEASASGTPCVTGRSGGTAEAVVDGITGYVVDATDTTQLFRAIDDLLSSFERRATMGTAARVHATSTFGERVLPDAFKDWLGLT